MKSLVSQHYNNR